MGDNFYRICRITLLTLFIVFIVMYLSIGTGYYSIKNNKKTALTNSAIKKYEKDIKAGKKIDVSNYLEKEKNYSNNVSIATLQAYKIIEVALDKTLTYLFNEIGKTIKNK